MELRQISFISLLPIIWLRNGCYLNILVRAFFLSILKNFLGRLFKHEKYDQDIIKTSMICSHCCVTFPVGGGEYFFPAIFHNNFLPIGNWQKLVFFIELRESETQNKSVLEMETERKSERVKEMRYRRERERCRREWERVRER